MILGWLGCAGPPGGPDAGDTGAWDALQPVLARCAGCHDGAGLATPLLAPADWHAFAEAAAELVAAGDMPPWPAGPADVAYADDGSLDPDDRSALLDWLRAGAPTPAGARPVAPAPRPALDRVDAVVAMPEARTPETAEETRCFALGPPPEAPVSGVEVVPGPDGIAHHVLASVVASDDPDTSPAALDAADPAPGWACPEWLSGSRVVGLGGWLPGRSPTVLPAGVGLVLPEGGELVLQGHYLARAGRADRSEIHLRLEPAVDRRAAELRLAHSGWVAPAVAVGAHADRTWRYASTVAREVVATDLDGSRGVEVLAVVPHLHTYGVRVRVSVVTGGQERVLVDIPSWDYDWQLTYTLAEPLPLDPSDELRLLCAYHNDTDRDVTFGESVDDEMCVARLLVAEAR